MKLAAIAKAAVIEAQDALSAAAAVAHGAVVAAADANALSPI